MTSPAFLAALASIVLLWVIGWLDYRRTFSRSVARQRSQRWH